MLTANNPALISRAFSSTSNEEECTVDVILFVSYLGSLNILQFFEYKMSHRLFVVQYFSIRVSFHLSWNKKNQTWIFSNPFFRKQDRLISFHIQPVFDFAPH